MLWLLVTQPPMRKIKSMVKPRIAFLPLHVIEKDTIWINPLYLGGVETAGGIPCILPLHGTEENWRDYIDAFDGFVFTGGQDISPNIYGEKKLPACHYQSHLRDQQEVAMIRLLLQTDKAVLGICRGAQIINAACGGTLYQDLPTQHSSAVVHCQVMPYDLPHHQVRIIEGTQLSEILKVSYLSVNSMHHQAIHKVAPCFQPSAIAEDGIIEAIECPDKRFFIGVQWHPEFLWQGYASARILWKEFVKAAAESSANGCTHQIL